MAATTESITLVESDNFDWDHIHWLEDIERYIRNYVIGSTIILGSIGNMLSVITLQTKSFRGTASGFVLTALALADLVVLNSGAMHEILINNDIEMSRLSKLSCKAQYYAQVVSVHISSWTLVLVTFERMIAVVWPHKVHLICTRKKLIMIWSVIVAFLLLAEAYDIVLIDLRTLVEHDEVTNTTYMLVSCTHKEEFEQQIDNFADWYDLLVSVATPAFLIITANVVIIRTLALARVNRMLSGNSSPAHKTSSVTVMLIVVCMVFVVTMLPARIYSFGMDTWFPNIDEDPLERQMENLCYTLVMAILYTNFAINFVLYLVTGTRFRKAFIGLFRCCQRSTTGMAKDAATMSSNVTSESASVSQAGGTSASPTAVNDNAAV